ncbi:hypothetical protein [Gilliamella sp. A7]|uniref:hypothetical protein n=1 Tax=Gilliamella sp. A7 TaxID=1970465 RepID=UPI000A357974|nr:hypothetical protein [Gilliamella sp. A7]OTQ58601.1 hypothetical protein B6D18_06390 [Gilliamella sp. A7]
MFIAKKSSRCLFSIFSFHATAISHPGCAKSSVMSFIPLDKNSYACWLIEFTKQPILFFSVIAY